MEKKQTLTLQASGTDFSVKTESHSNKMRFTATVMYLDQYSDGVPGGTVWDKILLEKSECEKALDTMNLMGINCVWNEWSTADWQFYGHDPRNKIGVVEKTYIEGNELKIDGIIYKNDFQDISRFIKNIMDSIGFSIEASFNDWEETEEGVIIRDVEFTGVSMLFKNYAAYSDTYIETLSASKKEEIMTQEERNTFMEEVTNSIMAKINEAQEQEKQANELEALKAQIETLQASNKALEEENNGLKANAKTVDAESKEEPSKEKEEGEKEEEPKEDVKASTVTSDLKTKAKFVEASKGEYRNYGAYINAYITGING